MFPKLFSYKELAAEMRLHESTIRRLFRFYKHVSYSKRTVRIPESSVQQFLSDHPEYVPSPVTKSSVKSKAIVRK